MSITSGDSMEDFSLYVYSCDDCFESEDKTEEQHKNIVKKIKKRKDVTDKYLICPFCGLKQFKFTFKLNKTRSFNKNRIPRTVGTLAEINYRQNKDKIEEDAHNAKLERYEGVKEKARANGVEVPDKMPEPETYGTKSYEEINKMTDEQKKKYIKDGE